MRAYLKRSRLIGPCALFALSLSVALYALGSLWAVPAHFQFLWPAPAAASASASLASDAVETTADEGTSDTAAQTNTGLRDARKSLETVAEQLEGACEPLTLYAVADGMSVIASMDNATAATARLEALEDGAFALKPLELTTGRLIYPEEFQQGERVILLDEKLAVALFNYAEPIDRLVLLGGAKYRVVGIVRDARRVGDHQAYTLYVPYRAVEKSALTMSALYLETKPVPNAGGWAAFQTATASLSAQGTCLSLPKEEMNATLPLRALACLSGFLALLFGLRVLNARAVRLYRRYRERLRGEYALRLAPWAAARALPLLLGYAACAAAFAWVFLQAVEPVYTFPEWIPTVLVEPTDISAAFWNVWQNQAALLELRSPELIRVRFFARLMGWACGGLALSGGMIAARLGDALRPLLDKPASQREPEEKKPRYTLD